MVVTANVGFLQVVMTADATLARLVQHLTTQVVDQEELAVQEVSALDITKLPPQVQPVLAVQPVERMLVLVVQVVLEALAVAGAKAVRLATRVPLEQTVITALAAPVLLALLAVQPDFP
jgi:hypothetical protein